MKTCHLPFALFFALPLAGSVEDEVHVSLEFP
jgi:hypothetical protein